MKKLKFALVAISAVIVCFLLIGFGWLRSSLPVVSGEIRLSGISDTVVIARDEHGVPHIDAANDDDLAFATGYAHAQDRLWQMEMNRRIGHGRVAEVLGEQGLGFDRYFRTLGFTRRAQTALDALPADVISNLEAYAAGVNSFLRDRRGALPPEFILTGVTPEPWRPIDTLVWQKMMWLDLSGNARQEVARARLLAALTPEQVATIFPAYPGDDPNPIIDLQALYAQAPIQSTHAAIGPEKPAGYGSNNWVVSGDNTESGMPLLANDPHLGLTTPSIWYLVRLHNRTEGTNTVGVSFPGSPSVVLGRNDNIAWGFTNTAPDVMDLFIEKRLSDTEYLTPDGPAPFTRRTEVIYVRGGDPIELTVLETRHGPVVSDIYPGADTLLTEGHVIALQWTALADDDGGVVALQKLGKARNFAEFKEAGRTYGGPQQNMIYADTDGNIGYFAPALVPVRRADNEINGRFPSPGWLAKYDWQGFIPFEELPTRYNPEGGVIATANEKIIDDNYPHFITGDWSLPYRGNRIRHQLSLTDKHTPATFGVLHADIVSDMARDLLPWMLAVLEESDQRKLMADWDGSMDMNRPEPLVFYTWLRHYQRHLMADELGDLYSSFTRNRPRLLKSSLYWAAGGDGSNWNTGYYALPVLDRTDALAWCDNTTTDEKAETCANIANMAMADAMAELISRHGPDAARWTWGSEHTLHQSHRPMSQIPALKNIFGLTAPVSGGRFTVNVAGVSQQPENLNQSTFGPSYRGVFDMANLDRSLFVQPTGQSGNPLSRHFGDLFDLWRNVDYFEIPTATTVPANATAILYLTPEPHSDESGK